MCTTHLYVVELNKVKKDKGLKQSGLRVWPEMLARGLRWAFGLLWALPVLASMAFGSPATQSVSETARTMASPPPRGTGRWWRDLFSGTSMTCALFRSGITTAVKDAETPAVSTRPLRSATVMRPAPVCAVREPAISIGVPTGLPRQ